jgi:hypothetical protein
LYINWQNSSTKNLPFIARISKGDYNRGKTTGGQDMDIMMIMDAVILLFGLYMLVSALKMKKSGVISELLLTREEIARCKKTADLITFIYWREAAFGVVLAAAGVLGLVNERLVSLGNLKFAGLAVFLAAFLWFRIQLKNARERFL